MALGTGMLYRPNLGSRPVKTKLLIGKTVGKNFLTIEKHILSTYWVKIVIIFKCTNFTFLEKWAPTHTLWMGFDTIILA